MSKFKVGEKVRYQGRISTLPGTEEDIPECIIESLQGPDEIFNQPMATLNNVDHWVSQSELYKL